MSATLKSVSIPVVCSSLPRMPAATITTALLLPQDRIAREPLEPWASRLAATLGKHRQQVRTPRELSGRVAAVANNAALMALHGGAPSTARKLCWCQFRWHSRLGRRSRNPEVAADCVPPWVNQGRLESLEGAWQAALIRFAALMRDRNDEAIQLGTTRLCIIRSNEAGESRAKFEAGLEAAYVIDSLRALLANGRFAEVIAFANQGGSHRWWKAEANAVAAGRLGDFDRARHTLDEALRDARGWNRLVFKLRRAETLACAGDPGHAAEVLLPVVSTVGQVSPAAKAQLQSLYVLLRLAAVCGELGLEAEAVVLGRDVYEGGRTSGDEVFQIEGLRILAALASARERSRWQDLLARLEETTGYRKYRPGGEQECHGGALDRLCGELLELFSG